MDQSHLVIYRPTNLKNRQMTPQRHLHDLNAMPDGRQPGQRGQATRQKLLDATVHLVAETPWRSVKVTDIARRAGTSPATFYQYFENVEGAITVLAEEIINDASGLADLADEGDWSPEFSWQTARKITEGFFNFWQEHGAIFRVLEFDTSDVDAGLRGLRVRALNAVTVALAASIASGQHAYGHTPPTGGDPMAMAGALVAMMASVSAHRYGFEFWGIRTASLLDAQAHLIHGAVTGSVVSSANGAATSSPRPRTGPVPGASVIAHRRPS